MNSQAKVSEQTEIEIILINLDKSDDPKHTTVE